MALTYENAQHRQLAALGVLEGIDPDADMLSTAVDTVVLDDQPVYLNSSFGPRHEPAPHELPCSLPLPPPLPPRPPQSRSVFVGALKPGPRTGAELCLLANSFGALESVRLHGARAFLNFLEDAAAREFLRVCTAQPVFIGGAQVHVRAATAPTVEPWLQEHIAAGATRNLFLANYGPARLDDVRALFAQFCEIVDIVIKRSYAFVHTSSVAGAVQAKARLEGMFVGGKPIVLNFAKEKGTTRDSGQLPSLFARPHAPWHHTQAAHASPAVATRNLHVCNYGPATSAEALRALFELHCEVLDVVLKDDYCFVNTSSVEGAVAAKRALQGAPVNDAEIKINFAKDNFAKAAGSGVGGNGLVIGVHGAGMNDVHGAGMNGVVGSASLNGAAPLNGRATGARLPPSKSLHVSNFGPGTTEHEVAGLFAWVCPVKSVVMKPGNYCFVNTVDVDSATAAMDALQNHQLRGGAIQINFARDRAPATLHGLVNGCDNGFDEHPRGVGPGVGVGVGPIHPFQHASRSLHVSGFGAATTRGDVAALFAAHCTVKSVFAKAGYCFVNCTTVEGAVAARTALQGFVLGGRPIHINFAKDWSVLAGARGTRLGDAAAVVDPTVAAPRFDRLPPPHLPLTSPPLTPSPPPPVPPPAPPLPPPPVQQQPPPAPPPHGPFVQSPVLSPRDGLAPSSFAPHSPAPSALPLPLPPSLARPIPTPDSPDLTRPQWPSPMPASEPLSSWQWQQPRPPAPSPAPARSTPSQPHQHHAAAFAQQLPTAHRNDLPTTLHDQWSAPVSSAATFAQSPAKPQLTGAPSSGPTESRVVFGRSPLDVLDSLDSPLVKNMASLATSPLSLQFLEASAANM